MNSRDDFGFPEIRIYSQDIDLTEAVVKGNYNDVANLLFQHNASQTVTSKHGNYPLHISAVNGDTEIFQLLLSKGGDLSVVNDHFQTPFHAAIESQSFEIIIMIVNHFLDNEIKIDQLDMDNALLEAAAFDHYECAELLISIGAHSNEKIKNKHGAALDNAWGNNNERMVNLLLEREANAINLLFEQKANAINLLLEQQTNTFLREALNPTNKQSNQNNVSETKIVQEYNVSLSAVALLFISSKNQPAALLHPFTAALLDKILQHLADVMNKAGAGFMNAASAVSGAIVVDRFIVDYGNLGFFSKTSEGDALADNLDKNRKDPRMIKGLVRNYLASDVKTPAVVALLDKHKYTEDTEISNFLPLMKDWNELIKKDPNNPALYYERGSFYQGKGMVKEAFLDYVKILNLGIVRTSADYEKAFELLERLHNKASQKLYSLLMSVTHPNQLDGIDKEDLSDAIGMIIITKQKYAVMEKCVSPNNALYNYLKHGMESFLGIRTHKGEWIIDEMEEKLQNHFDRYDNAVKFQSRL